MNRVNHGRRREPLTTSWERNAIIVLAIITVIVLADLIITHLAISHGCQPGPRPYGWTAQQYDNYAATACSNGF